MGGDDAVDAIAKALHDTDVTVRESAVRALGEMGNRNIHLLGQIVFGESDPALVFTEQLSNVPPEYQLVGAEVQFQDEAGEIKLFVVTEMNDSELVIDGNNPLVGRNLKFRVSIHAIRDASAEEIAQAAAS